MTNQKQKKNFALSLFIILSLILLDQVVKVLARAYLRGTIGYSFLDGFVKVEYAENRGAFLSLGAQLSDEARTALFIFMAGGMLVFCAYWLWKSLGNRFAVISYSLVIAGGVGNLIDRIFRGSVTDYVHMGLSSLRTGVFNVADVAISCGFVFLLILQSKSDDKEEKPASS
jgi:signal peptidase II